MADALAASPGGWPWPTLIVNLVGSFMLGYFHTRLGERLPPSVYQRPFLATGLCGGLTTFSTMQVELLRMLDRGRPALALVYAAVSLLAGLAAVIVSTHLVRRTSLVR